MHQCPKSSQTLAPQDQVHASGGRSRCTGGTAVLSQVEGATQPGGGFPFESEFKHLAASNLTLEQHLYGDCRETLRNGSHFNMEDRSQRVKKPRLSQAEPKSQRTRRKLKGFRRVLRERPACLPSTLPARKEKKSVQPAAPDHRKRNRTDRDH